MALFSINNENIILPLTRHKSKIRIADVNGNHISKTTECVIRNEILIEWMITNNELNLLIETYLNDHEKLTLIKELRDIQTFIKDSEYVKRAAAKGRVLTEFKHFEIYEYVETFYSFETTNANGIKIRTAIKMGDFTLNPHFYVLIPFEHNSLSIRDRRDKQLKSGEMLGSGGYGIWNINTIDVKDIIKTIGYTSTDHRNDMIRFLSEPTN